MTLSGGTIFSQIIAALSNIVLSRIYSSEQFAELSIFYSVITIGLVIVNLRYDIAITQMKSQNEAINGLIANFLIVSFMSFFFCFGLVIYNFLFFNSSIRQVTNNLLLPIGITVLFGGFLQAIIGLYNRQTKYKYTAQSGVVKSLSISVTSIGFGFINEKGLIIGQVLGSLAGFLAFYSKDFVKQLKEVGIKIEDLRSIIVNYSEYPKFLLLGAVLDTIAVQLPFFFILNYYGQSDLGYYSFSYRVITLPFSFIIGSFTQVFIQNFTTSMAAKSNLFRIIINRLKKLGIIVALVSFLTVIVAPYLFDFFFGHKWSQAAALLIYIVLPLAIRFIVSPLSSILVLRGLTRYALIWQILYFVIVLSTFLYYNTLTLMDFLKLIIILDVMLYALYLIIILLVARKYSY